MTDDRMTNFVISHNLFLVVLKNTTTRWSTIVDEMCDAWGITGKRTLTDWRKLVAGSTCLETRRRLRRPARIPTTAARALRRTRTRQQQQ